MQKHSQQQIFQTQPIEKLTAYELYVKEVKNYAQNLNKTLGKTFNDQNKSIKRKRHELQKELQYLRQKYFNQRKRIREMEEYFVLNCVNVIKTDIKKWEQNQTFFNSLFQHYQYEIEIQSLINQRNRQKVQILKDEVKSNLRQEIKQIVADRLEVRKLSKGKDQANFRSKKCLSVKSSSKIKTQATQITKPTQRTQPNEHMMIQKRSHRKKTQMQQSLMQTLHEGTQRTIRMKTEMSLPTLKKQKTVSPSKLLNDDFNFMKPIRRMKNEQENASKFPQIIKLFKQHNKMLLNSKESNDKMDWFEKVVFNKRNFEKIIKYFELQHQNFQILTKKKYSESGNKVKDLVAKNLFRLKTESTPTKSLINLKVKQYKQRSLLSTFQKSQQKSQILTK